MGFASWQRYCTALQYWPSAKLCGIEQTAPPIFGRAAITLGIGPHSSITVWKKQLHLASIPIFHMTSPVCFAKVIFADLQLWRYHFTLPCKLSVFTARSELRKVLFWALSVTFLFMYDIPRDPLNGFAPNSQGKCERVRSLAWTNLKVKANFGGLRVVYTWKNAFALHCVSQKRPTFTTWYNFYKHSSWLRQFLA